MTDAKEAVKTEIIEQDDFVLLDREDEQHILAELSGRNLEKFVFQTHDGPKLTYTGLNWAAREYEKRGECFRPIGKPEPKPDLINPAEFITVDVTVGRYLVAADGTERLLGAELGSKRKWIKQELKDGRVVPDPFFYEKCVSMAYRNGKRKLMDSEFVNELIGRALAIQEERKSGKKTQAAKPAAKPAAAPPAQPAKPPAQPAATPAASADKPDLAKMQTDLAAAFLLIEPDSNKHKALWVALTKTESTAKAPFSMVRAVLEAVRGVSMPNPVNRFECGEKGPQIVRIADGKSLFPEEMF